MLLSSPRQARLGVPGHSVLELSDHSGKGTEMSGAETSQEERDVEMVATCREGRERILAEVQKVIVGQDVVIEDVLIALFAGGHILLVGVPGLAKTLLISTLSQALSLQFKRIQFTPDLMPSDITGTEVIEEDVSTGKREFKFVQGPIFCNMLLADEINRTPPKTQAALLQAMQERQVSVGRTTYDLDHPFMVLATQNPIEQEGTYPLPEAQQDRFMFNTFVDYPSDSELAEIIVRVTSGELPVPDPVLAGSDILEYQQIVKRVPMPKHVVDYIVRINTSTRPDREDSPDFIRRYVSWGAGPRAGLYLALGAKSRAILHGRFQASCDDVRAVARSVLRHRIFVNFTAQAEGVDAMRLIDQLLGAVKEG